MSETLEEAQGRARYWEDAAVRYREGERYYRVELEKAHTLLGRITHQMSERWDSMRISSYFPTDNAFSNRTHNNPSGQVRPEAKNTGGK